MCCSWENTRENKHHLHSQHKHQVMQDKLVQVQFSWSGFWPEFSVRCPNLGTNSHVVFVVHPNHRWSLYVLGYVQMTIWPCSLTGNCLELTEGNVTWASTWHWGPCSCHKTTSITRLREQELIHYSVDHGVLCFLKGVRPSNWGVHGVFFSNMDCTADWRRGFQQICCTMIWLGSWTSGRSFLALRCWIKKKNAGG